ncbi:MAG: sel1 repeat family protein [Proteobacteria bacterium]|nr:sel1 repeat family protein [Pseudomonadota bacterium]
MIISWSRRKRLEKEVEKKLQLDENLDLSNPDDETVHKCVDLALAYMENYYTINGALTLEPPSQKNKAKALKYINIGVNADDPDAIKLMGDIYYYGVNTKEQQINQDYQQAKSYYERAIDKNGQIGAMYQLGLMYYKGLGVPKDKEIARSWMQKSSDGGYKLAKQWINSHGIKAWIPFFIVMGFILLIVILFIVLTVVI